MTRTVSLPYGPQPKYRQKQMYKKTVKGSKKMKALIKKTITQMAEKKIYLFSGANLSLFTVAGTAPNAFSLVPSITQGAGQNQRIGNSIKVVSGTIRGHIIVRPYDAIINPTVAPVSIKFWLCQYLKSNTTSIGSTDAASAFFDTGAGTSGMTGNIVDLDFYPNTDSWKVLETQQYRLGLSGGTNNAASTVVTFFDNSPAQIAFEFKFGSRLGTCLFNDTTNDTTNRSLFLVVQPVYSNGATTSGFAPVEMDYATQLTFIDI